MVTMMENINQIIEKNTFQYIVETRCKFAMLGSVFKNEKHCLNL